MTPLSALGFCVAIAPWVLWATCISSGEGDIASGLLLSCVVFCKVIKLREPPVDGIVGGWLGVSARRLLLEHVRTHGSWAGGHPTG